MRSSGPGRCVRAVVGLYWAPSSQQLTRHCSPHPSVSLAVTVTWASTTPLQHPLGYLPLSPSLPTALSQSPGGAREVGCGGSREGFFWLVAVP